jgi:glycosyltransferase involved in cell wall biosynthesis
MKFLLIAYDFPPIPSPQALRWAYLTRELAQAGHQVMVLAPDVPGYGAGGLPELGPRVEVHRVCPGPITRLLYGRGRPVCRTQAASMPGIEPLRHARSNGLAPWIETLLQQAGLQGQAVRRHTVYGDGVAVVELMDGTCLIQRPGQAIQVAQPYDRLNWKGRLRERVLSLCSMAGQGVRWVWERLSPLCMLPLMGGRVVQQGLNWKGHLSNLIKSLLGLFMFPDHRAEWAPWARRKLAQLLQAHRPDVVITSHEPANSIPLGALAKQMGFAWIADLGDPVLAAYTPYRWRQRAHALERLVCEKADFVTVTSVHARDLLMTRHGIGPDRCHVVTQGYDHRFDDTVVTGSSGEPVFTAGILELLYTGSFYSFRRPDALIAAVLDTPGVRLSVASIMVPDVVVQAAAGHPESVRILGFLPHTHALMLQRRCDVLVNIANADHVQIPGKLYEYLGAQRPILHITDGDADPASGLIRDSGGWCVADDTAAIAALLRELVMQKQRLGCIELNPDPDFDRNQYTWERLASRLVALAGGGVRR